MKRRRSRSERGTSRSRGKTGRTARTKEAFSQTARGPGVRGGAKGGAARGRKGSARQRQGVSDGEPAHASTARSKRGVRKRDPHDGMQHASKPIRWLAREKGTSEWKEKLTQTTWYDARKEACRRIGCDQDHVELKSVDSVYG